MADNEDKDFQDDFSPESTNESTSEFNPDENPYEDFLSGVDAASVKAEEEVDEDVKKAFYGEDSAQTQQRTAKETPSESSSREESLTTEKDIDIPDFLQTEGVNEETFQSSLKDSTSKEDDFVPSTQAENQNKNEGQTSNTTETFSASSASEDDDSSSDDVDSEEGDKGFTGGNTEDVEKETQPFQKKMSAAEADSKKPKGAKPKVLNKRFLLSAIIIVVGLIFLVTFLMPAKSEKKNDKNGKPVATTRQGIDYASLANRPAETPNHYQDINAGEEKKESKKSFDEVEIPPVIPKTEKQPYTQNNINYGSGKGGGGTAIEIPDTRNDSLHGKSISGIKGLTPSQNSYQTDYQQTVAKNTASGRGTSSNTLPSKEEFMNSYLNSYTQAYGNATAGNNSYANQNDQAGKNSFYNKGRNASNVGQGEYLNLNTLWQGSIFEAVLTSELNTDLPGEITARIAKNIYSSQDGRYLLIPQNSVLYGSYNSSISYSQSRVQVAWHTLVRPDGYQVQLGSMNATDAKGASGLTGFVNDHPMAYLKAIGLMSVFSIVNSEFQSSMGNTDNEYVQNVLANTQEVTAELGEKLIDRAMNVQPTIKIKAGTKINIVVNQNLSLPPCEDIPVTQKYRRVR